MALQALVGIFQATMQLGKHHLGPPMSFAGQADKPQVLRDQAALSGNDIAQALGPLGRARVGTPVTVQVDLMVGFEGHRQYVIPTHANS